MEIKYTSWMSLLEEDDIELLADDDSVGGETEGDEENFNDTGHIQKEVNEVQGYQIIQINDEEYVKIVDLDVNESAELHQSNEEEIKEVEESDGDIGEYKVVTDVTFDPVYSNKEIAEKYDPPIPYERNGRTNFFWSGLDPKKDELLLAARKQSLGKNFMCGFCYKWESTKEDLIEHMRSVHAPGVARFHQCELCGKRYLTRFLLQRHTNTHKYEPTLPHSSFLNSEEEEFAKNQYLHYVKPGRPTKETYEDCIKTFSELARLTQTVSCMLCDVEYDVNEVEKLIDHYGDVHSTITCKLCASNKEFDSFSDLKIHLIEAHSLKFIEYFDQGHSKVWKRIEAEERFKEQGSVYVRHIHPYAQKPSQMPWLVEKKFQMERRGLFVDNVLEFILGSARDALSRIQIESNVMTDGTVNDTNENSGRPKAISSPAYMNDITTYSDSTDLPPTSKNVSPKTNLIFRRTCSVCKKSIQCKGYKKHLATHFQIYMCLKENCGKRFSSANLLLTHRTAHMTDRPYKCDVCGRAYNWSSLLTRHKRIHTGELPYECDLCHRKFKELVSFHYHRMKVHTGERPHRCPHCGRGFILSNDLKKHLRVHRSQLRQSPLPLHYNSSNSISEPEEVDDFGPSTLVETSLEQSEDIGRFLGENLFEETYNLTTTS